VKNFTVRTGAENKDDKFTKLVEVLAITVTTELTKHYDMRAGEQECNDYISACVSVGQSIIGTALVQGYGVMTNGKPHPVVDAQFNESLEGIKRDMAAHTLNFEQIQKHTLELWQQMRDYAASQGRPQ